MAQGVIPAPQAAPRVTGQLRREVGLTSLMFISLGSIIGSGWLLGALLAAQIAGPASLLSWILGGAIIALLALIHAELGSAYPMAGGTARFPHLVFEDLRSLAEEMLAKVEQERGKPTTAPTSIELLNGPPAEIIEEFLRPSDLLVIGSRGIGGVRRLLLGSVSSALVQAAPCPVVVVRPEPGTEGGRPAGR
jgi:nucleotide-binding universal stress UspA family protein